MQLYRDFTELRVHVRGWEAAAVSCWALLFIHAASNSHACLKTFLLSSVRDAIQGSFKLVPECLLKISFLISSHQELHCRSQGKGMMGRWEVKKWKRTDPGLSIAIFGLAGSLDQMASFLLVISPRTRAKIMTRVIATFREMIETAHLLTWTLLLALHLFSWKFRVVLYLQSFFWLQNSSKILMHLFLVTVYWLPTIYQEFC